MLAFACALPQLCFFITWTKKAPPAPITKSLNSHVWQSIRTGCQFEPYPYHRMRLHAGSALVV